MCHISAPSISGVSQTFLSELMEVRSEKQMASLNVNTVCFINLKMRVNLNTCTYVEHTTYRTVGTGGCPPPSPSRFWQKR